MPNAVVPTRVATGAGAVAVFEVTRSGYLAAGGDCHRHETGTTGQTKDGGGADSPPPVASRIRRKGSALAVAGSLQNHVR